MSVRAVVLEELSVDSLSAAQAGVLWIPDSVQGMNYVMAGDAVRNPNCLDFDCTES